MANYKGNRKQISLYLSEESRLAYKELNERGMRPTHKIEKLLIKLLVKAIEKEDKVKKETN